MNREGTILLEREFFSNREELTLLPRLLEEMRQRCPIAESQFFNLVVAMTEAVNNAIEHGNQSDPTRRVRYSVECRDREVYCVVEDEGEGFELDDLADPTSPENILSEGGRGMFLIQALMRDLRVERIENGMRIAFVCDRE